MCVIKCTHFKCTVLGDTALSKEMFWPHLVLSLPEPCTRSFLPGALVLPRGERCLKQRSRRLVCSGCQGSIAFRVCQWTDFGNHICMCICVYTQVSTQRIRICMCSCICSSYKYPLLYSGVMGLSSLHAACLPLTSGFYLLAPSPYMYNSPGYN